MPDKAIDWRLDTTKGMEKVMWTTLYAALRRLGGWACAVLLAMTGTMGQAHALSCPTGKVLDGGLCYSPPQTGYSCTGSLCMENCPAGYSPSVPGFCHYRGATTYPEGPYIDRKSNHPHKCGLLFYAKCRADYQMDACGICSYKGSWDTTRRTYWRAAGVSADFTQAFNTVGSTMQATYGGSIAAMQAAYYRAAAEVQKFADAVLLKIFQTAARIQLPAQGELVTALNQSITAFKAAKADPNQLNDMKRILTLVAKNKQLVDGSDEVKDIATVMLRNASAVGLSSNVQSAYRAQASALSRGAPAMQASRYPSNAQNSSWGIFSSVGGAVVAGADESIGIIMNRLPDPDGTYRFAVVHSTAGSVGLAYLVGGDIGFLWNPGPIDAHSGPFVGLTAALEYYVGVTGTLAWNVSKGMRGAQNAIPSIAAGAGPGLGGQVSLVGGNSWVLQKFSFKPPV